jgi:hypothetical protein
VVGNNPSPLKVVEGSAAYDAPPITQMAATNGAELIHTSFSAVHGAAWQFGDFIGCGALASNGLGDRASVTSLVGGSKAGPGCDKYKMSTNLAWVR